MSLEDAIKELDEAEQELSKAQKTRNEKEEAILKKIQSGEFKGDPVKDFAIVYSGSLDESKHNLINNIGEIVKDFTNGLVVIERIEHKRHCFGGPRDDSASDYHEVKDLYIGKADGDVVWDLKEEKIQFPTRKYVFIPHDGNVEFHDEDLSITNDFLMQASISGGYLDIPIGRPMSVYVGEGAINHIRSILFSSGKIGHYLKKMDIELPQELEEYYTRYVDEERETILKNIEHCTYALERFTEGEKKNSDNVIEELKVALGKAVEFDLHTIEGELNKPGVKLDRPEYIRNLCEEYKIEYAEQVITHN